MKFSSTLALLILASCACATQEPLPVADWPAPESGLEDALDATVGLVVPIGQNPTKFYPFCAGVRVEGHVLTAYHCIDAALEEKRNVWVGAYKDLEDPFFLRAYEWEVVAYDAIQDSAILRPIEGAGIPALTYGGAVLSPAPAFVGQAVVTVGHPMGLPFSIMPGVVSFEHRQDIGGMDWMQITAPVSGGNSGGPVFSRWGEVLGLVSFRVGNGIPQPHLAGCIHLTSLYKMLAPLKD